MIDIYVMSGIKGPKIQDGYTIYILASTVKVKKMIREGEGGRMVTKDETVTLTKGLHLTGTNGNRSQLTTLLEALRRITKPGELCVHMDSEWVRTGITEWVPKWQGNGWMTTRNEPVSFWEEWEEAAFLLFKNHYSFDIGNGHPYREWMLAELEKREREGKYVREIWRDEQCRRA